MRGKFTKTEFILLASAIIFLLFLTAVSMHTHQVATRSKVVVETQYSASSDAIAPESRKINLNTASAKELESLPGIGEKLAEQIVRYRKLHGEFQTKKEIQKVQGIGEKRYAAIANLVTVKKGDNG